MNTYLAGSLIRVSVAFTLPDGTLTDPTAITLSYQPYPGAGIVSVTYPAAPVVRDSLGKYHADLDTTASTGDEFIYVWAGTGNLQAAAEGTFLVQVQFA